MGYTDVKMKPCDHVERPIAKDSIKDGCWVGTRWECEICGQAFILKATTEKVTRDPIYNGAYASILEMDHYTPKYRTRLSEKEWEWYWEKVKGTSDNESVSEAKKSFNWRKYTKLVIALFGMTGSYEILSLVTGSYMHALTLTMAWFFAFAAIPYAIVGGISLIDPPDWWTNKRYFIVLIALLIASLLSWPYLVVSGVFHHSTQ